MALQCNLKQLIDHYLIVTSALWHLIATFTFLAFDETGAFGHLIETLALFGI
jgi:hypothetical protein